MGGAAAPFLIDAYDKTDPAQQHARSGTREKQAALSYLYEAWGEARHDGIDDDCMAQACLFAAFAELVATYGEDAAARYAETLSARVSRGDFSVQQSRQ